MAAGSSRATSSSSRWKASACSATRSHEPEVPGTRPWPGTWYLLVALEVLAHEHDHCERPGERQVGGRPQRQQRPSDLRAAEGAEAQYELGQPVRVGRDPVERVLVERLVRQRPRRPARDRLERFRLERIADLAK